MTRQGVQIADNLWAAFSQYGFPEGVDIEGHEDDWGPWYDTWLKGWMACQGAPPSGSNAERAEEFLTGDKADKPEELAYLLDQIEGDASTTGYALGLKADGKAVAGSVVAGACFDLMAHLTTQDWAIGTKLEYGGAATNILVAWAKERGLNVDGADVKNWTQLMGGVAPVTPAINIKCETMAHQGGATGTTMLNVIRVEREDDGSFTAVTDQWPTSFKLYVHKRLDEANVPGDPDPAKTEKTGCRIGSRLDWVLERIPKAKPDKRLAWYVVVGGMEPVLAVGRNRNHAAAVTLKAAKEAGYRDMKYTQIKAKRWPICDPIALAAEPGIYTPPEGVAVP